MIFVPFLCFSVMTLFICQWVIIGVFLFSIKPNNQNNVHLGHPFYYRMSHFEGFCFVYMAIAVWWNCHFIGSFCQVLLSHISCVWYASLKRPQEILQRPILKSLRRVIKKQLGSIALGSIFISVLNFFRWFFKSTEKLVEYSGNNKCVLLSCCCCI